jgi:DNA polymerase III subunit delta'
MSYNRPFLSTPDLTFPPRLQKALIGHRQAYERLTEQWALERLHPAWLLRGQRGIGKATLAYRFARHILTYNQENSAFYGTLIDQNTHPNLFILERTRDEEGKLEADIKIDKVRALSNFVRQSPAIPGWRVVVIDALDELNRHAANSILKLLEEPPRQTLFLMVCHVLGGILPTIRSRCCPLPLHPLTETDLTEAGLPQESLLLADLSGGSIGRYLILKSANAAQILRLLIDLVQALLQGNIQPMLAFCAGLDKKDDRMELIPDLLAWLARQLVLHSIKMPQNHEISTKIQGLSQGASPTHWSKVQQTISEFLDLSRGAHADPLHLSQALFLMFK